MSMMKSAVCMLFALLILCGAASAEDKISIALSAGAFFPVDSTTKDNYDSCWTRISFKTFETEKPKEWRFIAEGGAYVLDGTSDVRLYPLTFGMEKGLNESRNLQPYVTLRAGPYYGKVTNDTGLNESKFGLNANASYGVTIKKRYYVEIRYDYFSELAGNNFDGFSLSAGVKLFDIKL
jgi:hypothetical protein